MTGEDEHEAVPPSAAGWRLLRTTLRGQRAGIVIGVSVGLVWTLAKVAVPALVQRAIDDGITPAVAQADAGLDPDLTPLWRWTAAILVAAVVAAAFTGIRRYWAFRVSRGTERVLRDRLFAHIQRLHFAYHDRVQTGDLLSRGNTDLQQIQQLVVLIPLTISNAVTVLLVTVVLFTINWQLALLSLVSLPFLNLLGKRFSTRLHPWVMAIQRESADVAAVVEEAVSGVRVVKGFGAEDVLRGRMAAETDQLYDVSMEAARIRARFLPGMELLPTIGLIAVLGYGGWLVLDGQLSVGQLVEFNVYIALLIWPLRMLGMIIAQGQRAAASAQRVHDVLAVDPVIVDPPHARPLPAVEAGGGGRAVRFEGVRFAYHPDAPDVLDGFDLELAPGESVALVGATGSGKTTVARLLPRFYDVDEGRITLDGVDVRDVALDELRRSIGLVFEDTFLFSADIAENIAFADPDAGAEAVERAARLAGAHEFIDALPDGYATRVGERGYSLSGGQRQRIAIARAIVADPRVLILDDATSAVDPTKEHEIRDAMAEVMRGRTTLVIAHRPATIALADRVVLIDGGRIVASGRHTELLASHHRYREVLAAADEPAPDAAGAAATADVGTSDAEEMVP